MTRVGTSENVRRLLNAAESLGGTYEGKDGRGHHVIDFGGQRYSVACSPSEWRGLRNAISDMERITGRKVPRQKSGRYSHGNRGSGFRLPAAPSAFADEKDTLHTRAGEIIAELRTVRSAGRSNDDRALELIREYESISDRLTELHQPPLQRITDAVAS